MSLRPTALCLRQWLPTCFLRKVEKDVPGAILWPPAQHSSWPLGTWTELESSPAFLPRTPAFRGCCWSHRSRLPCGLPSSALALWHTADPLRQVLDAGSGDTAEAAFVLSRASQSPDKQRHCGQTGMCSKSSSITRARHLMSL